MLKAHGIFWAGGKVVKRTQVGTFEAGDLKALKYTDQDILVGQAYVEYFVPRRLRNGKNTIPIVLMPGGSLIGAHFHTTPDGREGWATYFLRRGFPVYVIDPPGRGRAGFDADGRSRSDQGHGTARRHPRRTGARRRAGCRAGGQN